MKIKLLLPLLTVFFCQQLKAQKELEFEFENGEKKSVTVEYDDPDIMPKWEIKYKFFGLSLLGAEALSFRLSPVYRVNSKLTIQGNLAMPYAKGLDGNLDNVGKEFSPKRQRDWSLMGRYSIISNNKVKTKKLAVDYKSSGDVTTVYSVQLPRAMQHSLCLEGGFGGFGHYVGSYIPNTANPTMNADTFYRMSNVSFLTLNAGLSYYKAESYKITTDGVTRSYWRSARWYGYLTMGIKSSYTAHRLIKQTSGGGFIEEPLVSEATSGYQIPKVNGFGYRIGYEKTLGMKNSGCSITFGFEFGALPTLYTTPISDTDSKTTSASSIFMLHFGFGFGPKPSKLN